MSGGHKLTLTITSDINPTLMLTEELLSGRAYELCAQMLFRELFEKGQELIPLFLTGYRPVFSPVHLELIAPDRRFDQARGNLRLKTLGSAPFLFTVKFFFKRRLVAIAILTGRFHKGHA